MPLLFGELQRQDTRKVLKKIKTLLFTRAAQNRDSVFTAVCRAVTVRERGLRAVFSILLEMSERKRVQGDFPDIIGKSGFSALCQNPLNPFTEES
jgi:hypothetical protein